MTRARDIRFRGADDRLIGLAEQLGIDLGAFDSRTLPGAVADAVIERGLPDTQEARELFAELLRADSQEERHPVRLSANEELRRRRLLALGEELLRWAHRAGANLRRGQHHARAVRGINRVFVELARREGALPSTVKRWCMDDPDAKAMINMFRPVVSPAAEHPLQAAWR